MILLTPDQQNASLFDHTFTLVSRAVSTLTNFPLNQDVRIFSFLNQAIEDFEHGFNSILMDSCSTALDASFDQVDAKYYSVPSCFLPSVAISDNS